MNNGLEKQSLLVAHILPEIIQFTFEWIHGWRIHDKRWKTISGTDDFLGEEELANIQPVMMLIQLQFMTSQVVVTRLKCEEMIVVDVLLASQNLIRLDEVTPQPTLLWSS